MNYEPLIGWLSKLAAG